MELAQLMKNTYNKKTLSDGVKLRHLKQNSYETKILECCTNTGDE